MIPRWGRSVFWCYWQQILPHVAMPTTYAKFSFKGILPNSKLDLNYILHKWSIGEVDVPFLDTGNKCCQLLPWQPLMKISISGAYCWNWLVVLTILDMNDSPVRYMCLLGALAINVASCCKILFPEHIAKTKKGKCMANLPQTSGAQKP